MKKATVLVTGVLLAMLLFLGACAQKATPTTSTTATTPPPTTQMPTSSTPTAPKPTTSTVATLTSTTTAPATTPQYGGVLKILTTIGLTNLGYPPQGIFDQIYSEPAIETLVTLDPENKGEILPCLATAWQYNPDYKSLTFTLRKGVKFHDGTDFNAQAAKFCLDMSITSKQGLLSSVASVDAVDDYTLRLNLSRYEPSLLLDLVKTRNAMMVSPNAIKTMGQDAALHPVGTGPFKFVSYQRAVSLKYEKFADYWQKGKPYLDGIEFDFVADPVTALAAFQAGEGQALGNLSPKDATNLEKIGKFNVYRSPSSVFGFLFDSGNPDSPFANLKVRQAVVYATDIEAVNKACGYGLPATNQFALPNNWYYNPSIVGYPYNPGKAKQLLSEAGYSKGLSMSIFYERVGSIEIMATGVQSYLKDVGIDAKLVPQERALRLQTETGGWHNGMVWYGPMLSAANDPGPTLRDGFSTVSTVYKSVYHPTDFDALLNKALVNPDTSTRKAQFQDLEKMVIDQYCLAFPCYTVAQTGITNLQVHNYNFTNYGASIWNPENVWLSK